MNEDEIFIDDVHEGETPSEPSEPTPAAPAPAPAAGEATPTARERRLERELATERKNRQTSDETARYWQNRSTQQGAPAPKEDAAPAAPEIDLLEAITSGDKNQVKRALAGYGLVDKNEVAREIAQVRSSARTEALLEKDYPTLTDNQSPMFTTSARIYQELVRDEPALKGSPRTTLLAARLAEAELIRKGIDPHADAAPADGDDADAEDDEPVVKPKPRESEAARIRRVQSQSGVRRAPTTPQSREGDELSLMQKNIIQKFRDAGADSLTEDTFRKRAEAGVRMGGLPTAGKRK